MLTPRKMLTFSKVSKVEEPTLVCWPFSYSPFRARLSQLRSATGIVTRFDLQTHPLIKIQSTIDLYRPDKYAEVIKATIQIQEAMEKDPKIGLFTNFQKDFIAVGTIYAEEAEQQPAVFEPFKELDSLMMNVAPTSNGTLSSLAKAMAHRVEDSKK